MRKKKKKTRYVELFHTSNLNIKLRLSLKVRDKVRGRTSIHSRNKEQNIFHILILKI